MDKKEFKRKAQKRGIPDFLYNIDGEPFFNQVYDNEKWNVYYSERGCKTTNIFFNTEDEALQYMLNELSD